jgi:uncharacterized lipoprotein YmbA
MKKLFIAILVVALAGCKIQKTGKDTYRVVAPTPEAKKAGEKMKVQAKEVGAKLKAETEKLQEKVKTETTSTHK